MHYIDHHLHKESFEQDPVNQLIEEIIDRLYDNHIDKLISI